MENFYNTLLSKLEATIAGLEIDTDCCLDKIEEAIKIVIEHLFEIKEFVLKNGFKSTEEEILFFKYQKPEIVSKLIYYNSIYKIETKKPCGAKTIKKYYNEELTKIRRYFDNNLEFYKYYRTNNSSIDEKLFLRGSYDIKLSLDTIYFDTDHRFSTSHDYKAAKLIAHDMLHIYLEDQLNRIDQKKVVGNSKLTWTSSKAALTELIYALYSQGVFDNGNSDIKLISRTFENAFNVNLGDFYHTFLEIKSRKINRTKFLDGLRDALIKKMDEQEDKF